MSKVSESQIEAYLKKKVEALGGKCYKWVSPGNIGVPDRIVMLPTGLVFFVELKTDGGRLSPMQKKQAEDIKALGQCALVLWSRESIDDFIEILENHTREVMQ